MEIRHLGNRDALLVLEIIHDSLACRTDEQVRTLMQRMNNLLPYQAAASFITEIEPDSLFKEFTLVNLDYPDEYLKELFHRDLVSDDLILIENFKSFALQYWGDTLKKHTLTNEMKKIASLAGDFGFRKSLEGDGYSYGVRNLGGSEGSFFCYHGLERCPRTEEILRLVVPHLHETLRRTQMIRRRGAPLTKKETEVVQWLKEGKSTWDISIILGISERTVKFHVGNLMRKLDAVNRTHAVARAMELGIIRLD